MEGRLRSPDPFQQNMASRPGRAPGGQHLVLRGGLQVSPCDRTVFGYAVRVLEA